MKLLERPNPFVEADTLAVLFSEQTEYQMKKKQVSSTCIVREL